MKTLKWIAAALTLVLTMGVASAHDRDDGRRFDYRPFYGGYYVQPFFGFWNRFGDRNDRGRWDRDRDRWEHDRDRWDHDRDRRDYRGGRDGFRFRF